MANRLGERGPKDGMAFQIGVDGGLVREGREPWDDRERTVMMKARMMRVGKATGGCLQNLRPGGVRSKEDRTREEGPSGHSKK